MTVISVDISKEIEEYEDINLEEVEAFVVDIVKKEYVDTVKEDESEVYLSLLLTDNEEIKEINKSYRKKNEPTDVISFAYHETDDDIEMDVLGDIVVSLEKVEEQAKEYGHSFERELFYVITHGVLHLLGYDHINEEDKKVMREKEEDILERYGYRR